MKKGTQKIQKVMHEYKTGTLHSGSKTGPVVQSQKQAIAIALAEQKKAGKR
jgi:ribosomal protein L21E